MTEKRFEFGENWKRFLDTVNEHRIETAENSLNEKLGDANLDSKSFLDAGCGSGLFSLAARRLGAQVHSFDIDQEAIACAAELKNRYFPNDPNWRIEQGSVLDTDYLRSLGSFDVVYSWGVLHHTGAMWEALENILMPVNQGGHLFISIYNDQGYISQRWLKIKQLYVYLPPWLRAPVVWGSFLRIWGYQLFRDIVRGRGLSTWRSYSQDRGMSPWHDLVDWVGGYPFEVAKPEEIFNFYKRRGYALLRLKTCGGGRGCNEFVFKKSTA